MIGGLAAATVATLIVLPSVYSLVQQSAARWIPVDGSRRPGECVSHTSGMTMTTAETVLATVGCRHSTRCSLLVGTVACRSSAPAPATDNGDAGSGPHDVEVVQVVEQPLDVTLSLPGELTPYQSVAHLFASHRLREDDHRRSRFARPRGSMQLATLEAPELVGAAGRSAIEAAGGRGAAWRRSARKPRRPRARTRS